MNQFLINYKFVWKLEDQYMYANDKCLHNANTIKIILHPTLNKCQIHASITSPTFDLIFNSIPLVEVNPNHPTRIQTSVISIFLSRAKSRKSKGISASIYAISRCTNKTIIHKQAIVFKVLHFFLHIVAKTSLGSK